MPPYKQQQETRAPRNLEKTKPADLLARIHRQKEEVAALKELFADNFPPEFLPSDHQFLIWLRRHDFEVVVAGLERTSDWHSEMNQTIEKYQAEGKVPPSQLYKSKLDIIRYSSGTMIKMSEQEGE